MITIRDARWFTWGLTFCFVLIVANHTENHFRRQANAAHTSGVMNVNVEAEGGQLGHNSIGIDEASLTSSGEERFLHFATLGEWSYQRDKPAPCPKPLQDLSGQRFSTVGFMYPLESGDHVKTFCLLRSTQTCCYGPRPQFNQYILVETKTPVAFERLTPILVNGTFFVEPKPDDGYIYRMEARSVQSIGEDTPDTDPVKASQQAHLPLFDYAPLAAMEAGKAKTIPPSLLALAGKTVVAAGYCVHRTRSTPPRLMVEKSWWDGVAQGDPPTINNSVVVLPADSQQVPPLWKPYQVFTGVLQVTPDPEQWSHEGIVQLRNAHLGVPGVTPVRVVRNDLYIPWEAEVLLVGLVLLRSLRRRSPRSENTGRLTDEKA